MLAQKDETIFFILVYVFSQKLFLLWLEIKDGRSETERVKIILSVIEFRLQRLSRLCLLESRFNSFLM